MFSVHAGLSRFSRTDSLVGLYFEVSPFLKLVSVFVPAKGRTGTPRRLALQVQLVPFDQSLASHRPELRRRRWTEGQKRDSQSQDNYTSQHARLLPAEEAQVALSQGKVKVKVLMRARVESISISSQA